MKKISSVFDFIVEMWVEAVDLFYGFIGFVVLPILTAFVLLMLLFLIVGMWG